jgi:hypothetical protein
MIHTSFPKENLRQTECFQLTTPSIFQNNMMSLSFVMTFQPWFTKLLCSLGEAQSGINGEGNFQNPPSMSSSDLGTVDPAKLLNVLGYCPCSLNETPAVQLINDEDQIDHEVKDVTTILKQDVITNCCLSKNSESHEDSSDDSEVRKDDDYLLDTHPYEAKYFTNPKTGRKVKKLVCLVSG